MSRFRKTVLTFVVIGCSSLAAVADDATAPWQAKLHRVLREQRSRDLVSRQTTEPVEFLVVLAEQADLVSRPRAREAQAGAARVVERLRHQAETSQAPVVAQLETLGAEVQAFWVANLIFARGSWAAVEAMARRNDVARVEPNPRSRPISARTVPPAARKSSAALEWNISLVGADQVWALGYTGAGIVIGSQDTGFFWQHPALQSQYRGWDGVIATHDHNWHDAVHSDTLAPPTCPADSPEPCDDGFFFPHGTYTMGVTVGDDGATNRIGVSPGARWIGCRNSDLGGGTPASYTECFQWLLAPTDGNGDNPDPAMAPHVINNSWACIPAEGCNPDTLQLILDNVRAAGIVIVAAAGNDGTECETIDFPPAIYDSALTVGATDASDVIGSISSRGPVTIDGSGRLKPDLTAPGIAVRSAVGILDIINGGVTYDYLPASGTSAAAPHVAGAVALLLEARPDLIGDVATIEALLTGSALPLGSPQPCGGLDPMTTPNHVYGFGRLDVVELLLGDADTDGVSNLEDCAPLDERFAAGPAPIEDLQLHGGASTVLQWTGPSGQQVHDVLRNATARDWSTAACIESGANGSGTVDTAIVDDLVFYLIHVSSSCGDTAGSASGGEPRSVPGCSP